MPLLDPLYLIILAPAMLFAFIAQAKISSAYRKYMRVPTARGATGAQIAQAMLLANNIEDVQIEMTKGTLSDHYDPRKQVLRLSPAVYNGTSVAAAGIAAHEAGHALQHYEGYSPLAWRSLLVPVAGIGSNLAWIIFFVGAFLIRNPMLVNAAMILFTATVLFTIVTLPVEFNASKRAIAQLSDGGIISPAEEQGVRSVLNAAAMTYVAAALMAALQLLYMFMRRR